MMANAFDEVLTRAMGQRYSRRGLLRTSLAAGAAAVALSAFGDSLGGFTIQDAAAAGPLDSDVEILNYALTLELLEAAAYQAVNGMNVLTGRAKTYFEAFGAHEQAHVEAVRAAIRQLGGTPVQPPTGGYNFSGVPRDPAGIVRFFQMVETVGASAYLGAAPAIRSAGVLQAALAIHAVEAEHASALADLAAPGTDRFAPEPFATPRLPEQVMVIVAPFFQAQAAPQPSASPAPPQPSASPAPPQPSASPAPPQPSASPAPLPSMPGLPNTGGGGGHNGPGAGSGDAGETLRTLGLVGLGAATAGVLARRRSGRAAGHAQPGDAAE